MKSLVILRYHVTKRVKCMLGLCRLLYSNGQGVGDKELLFHTTDPYRTFKLRTYFGRMVNYEICIHVIVYANPTR